MGVTLKKQNKTKKLFAFEEMIRVFCTEMSERILEKILVNMLIKMFFLYSVISVVFVSFMKVYNLL